MKLWMDVKLKVKLFWLLLRQRFFRLTGKGIYYVGGSEALPPPLNLGRRSSPAVWKRETLWSGHLIERHCGVVNLLIAAI